MTTFYSIFRQFRHVFAIIVIAAVASGCAKRVSLPAELTFKRDVGDREVSEILFKTSNRIYNNDEIIKESVASVFFTHESVVKKVKEDGLFVSNNTVSKKDGLYDLHRLGLPDLDEEIAVESDKLGYILDVEGFPPDSIYYLPSLIFPKNPVSLGSTWVVTFRWRDYSVPFPFSTKIKFRLIRSELYKRNRVLRIQVSAASSFASTVEQVTFENHVEGYILWDPIERVSRYIETRIIDKIEIPDKGYKSVTESSFESTLKSLS